MDAFCTVSQACALEILLFVTERTWALKVDQDPWQARLAPWEVIADHLLQRKCSRVRQFSLECISSLFKFKFSLFTLIQKYYISSIRIGTKKRGKSELVYMLQ